MKARTKKLTGIATLALTAVMACSLGASGIFASADTEGDSAASASTTKSRYYTDFSSQAECVSAGEEFNEELAAEGITLLKNDGTLPLAKGAKVSVLGIAQDCMIETSGSITQSLRDAGFKVNQALENKYSADSASSSNFGTESELTSSEVESLGLYSDAAIVVIARGTAGESSDRSTNIGEVEEEKYLGEDQEWEHEALETDTDGNSYKHELELTDSEQALIKTAEDNCKKVIVLYSASYTFEMANLQDDDQINAIAWIGRLGDGGVAAVGEILSGEVNPSGKTVDEWTRDFTNDPTYANEFASAYAAEDESAIDYAGLDYEEDIYLGYKFYETYWAEANTGENGTATSGAEAPKPSIAGQTDDTITADDWYNYNVVYPFGYGLSYTTFSIELEEITTDADSVEFSNLSADNLSSSEGNPATVQSLTAKVQVTNTGDVAGKETVQIYVNAPYTNGGTEKAYLSLVGFGKTGTIKAGGSEEIEITFAVQDMASWDETAASGAGAYVLDAGTYNIYAMESSSHKDITTDGTKSFTLGEAATLQLDDFSENVVSNKFAAVYTEVEVEETEDEDNEDGTDSVALTDTTTVTVQTNEFYSRLVSDDAGSMEKTLSRADFDGTMPTAPTADTLKLSKDTISLLDKYNNFDADSYEDTEDDPWYVTEVPAGWNQNGKGANTDGSYIMLDDMAGVSIDDDKWTDFMNQLTWEEICSILNNGYHNTVAVDSIGKLATVDDNGPNYSYNLTTWVGEPTVSATWNTELCEEYGRMVGNTLLWQGVTGWYGPGMNIHRSQFAGRSPEYYSQDGLQSGYIAAAVVKGATDKGINVYVKHFAMYDTMALYDEGCANVTEQNMRENYLKTFQMAMQEGGAHAAMTSFNRIGAIYAGGNYNLIQGIARDEWGWTGFTVTDIFGQIPYMTLDILIRAGADFPDGDFSSTPANAVSGTWVDADTTNDETQGHVELDDGTTSATQWYCARMAAMRILYNEANSAGNYNGVTDSAIAVNVTVNQGAAVSSDVLPEKYTDPDAGYEITSSVTSGTMPEGLSIVDGVLAGTAYSCGDYSIVLTLAVDRWIPITLTLNVSIDAIIGLTQDISSVAVGEDVSSYAYFDTDALQNNNSSYTSEPSYSFSATGLPDGLSISDGGRITGSATTAGTYDVTIMVDAVNPNRFEYTALGEQLKDTLMTVTGATTDAGLYEQLQTNAMVQGMMAQMSKTVDDFMKPGTDTFYYNCTVTVASASSSVPSTGDEGGTSAGDDASSAGTSGADTSASESTGSSSNGLAIAGLVIGCVAVVAAAAAIVLVLLRKKSN